jgi:hypothetical protein
MRASSVADGLRDDRGRGPAGIRRAYHRFFHQRARTVRDKRIGQERACVR